MSSNPTNHAVQQLLASIREINSGVEGGDGNSNAVGAITASNVPLMAVVNVLVDELQKKVRG